MLSPKTLFIVLLFLCPVVKGQYFSNPVYFPAPSSGSGDAQAADMDMDGDIDVVYSRDAAIFYFENDGFGNFTCEDTILKPVSWPDFLKITLLDENNDGFVDIITVTDGGFENPNLHAFYNDGSGDFNLGSIVASYSSNVRSLYPYDISGDGAMDLVVVTSSFYSGPDNTVLYHRNSGSGLLSPSIVPNNFFTVDQVVPGDLDADGDIDLLLSNGFFSSRLQWHENTGGTFTDTTIVDSDLPKDMEIFDADMDGDNDILTIGLSGVKYYENLGGGNFSGASTISLAAGNKLTPHDTDGDGDLDFFAEGGGLILLWENLGGGAFNQINVAPGVFTTREIIDFDGDGQVDLMSVDNGGFTIHFSDPACSSLPEGLGASVSSSGTVTLFWFNVFESTKYQVKVRTVGAPYKKKWFTTPNNVFSLASLDFPPGTSYQWSVRAACPLDSTDWAPPHSFSIPTAKKTAASSIKIWPNPTTDKVSLSLGEVAVEGAVTAFLYDLNGKLVLEEQFLGPTHTLAVGNFPSGQYTLILNGNGFQHQRSISIY